MEPPSAGVVHTPQSYRYPNLDRAFLLRVRRERTTSGQQQRCHASSPPPVLCGRSGCGTDRAPNLYWRSANDLAEWATWLCRNPTIVTVSRDFSRTKQRAGFVPELRGLIEILRQVSRPMTVVVSGVGEEKMTSVVRAFRDVSASASFVTVRPVIAPPSATNGDLTSPCRAATVQARIDEFKSLATGEGKTAGSRLN